MTSITGTAPIPHPRNAAQYCLLDGGRLRLKGNCHCHTSYSDGAYAPQETVARYRDAGYDFLFLTDHCDKLDNGRLPAFDTLDSHDLRVLPGIEYRNTTIRHGGASEVHILGLNTRDLSHWKRNMHEQETIDAINGDGGFAVLAHPYWDARTIEDMVGLKGVGGIEIFNASVDSVNAKGSAVTHWEQLLECGTHLCGLAVDDLHAAPNRPSDFALAWIVVSVNEKTPRAITDAIRMGTFYSSCGPEIREWSIQGDVVKLRCSEVETIAFNSDGPRGRVFRHPDGETITEAQLPLDGLLEETGEDRYLRASCCDGKGRWAWTNPVWLNDLKQGCRALAMALALTVVAAHGATLDDIRFRAPFDGTADAELARGYAAPKAVSGPVRFVPGRFGNALVVGENGATLEYRIEGNLDTRQGAVSFWFKPLNWAPSETRSHVFLRFMHGGIFRLFTSENGRLVFEVGPDLVERRRASASLTSLRPEAWTHVVATWSAEQIQLFINGSLVDANTCAERFLPLVVNYNFQLGDMPRARGRKTPRITLIDDFTIFRRPIGPDEFGRIALTDQGKAPDYAPPVVSIVKGRTPFVIDGTVDDGERKQTAAFGNFLDVADNLLAAVPTTVRAGYTEDGLYVAVESPVLPGVPLKTESKHRDDQVWNDDAVQIYLAPPHGNKRFLFICNPEGVIFDRRYTIGQDHDPAWNADWRLTNRVEQGMWVMEVAIAFKELGVSTPQDGETWRLNVTRDRVEPHSLSCWPRLSAYADVEKHGYLHFLSNAPLVGAAAFAPVVRGQIAIDVEATPSPEDGPRNLAARLTASRAGAILLDRTFPLVLEDQPRTFPLREDTGGVGPDRIQLVVTDRQTKRELFRTTALPGELQTSLRVTCTPIPSEGICRVALREEDAAILERDPSALAELVPVGTTTPVRTVRIDAFSDGRAGGEFDIATLPSGRYELRARVVKGEQELDAAMRDFVKPPEPWREVHGEALTAPPSPWTPMETTTGEDGSVEIDCWGRRHRFDGMPFPAFIRNADAVQLAAPIRLELRVGGETVPWTAVSMADVEAGPTQVGFKTSMRAGPVALSATTAIEYDGMLWNEITLSPDGATTVDALDLVVPIDARYASLLHVTQDECVPGKTGREDGWTWDYPARRFFVWVGNEDLGLTWFYERPDQKRFADPDRFVRLERRGDTMFFKVRYVAAPTALSEPFTLKFGLQATPVRPRPKGWRSWGSPRSIGNRITIPWTSEEIDRYGGGYPEATNPGFYTRFIRYQKRYGRVVPYKILLWHAVNSPEWAYNRADWDLGGGVNKYSDTRQFWWGGRVCGAAETFTDFITWKMRQHIHEHQLDGVYHDLQWSYVCGNANHGCAPGRRAIRGDRELNKRLYTAMTQVERPLLKIDHCSSSICSATSGFCDMFVTGEQMCAGSAEPAKPHYRVWDDYFRALRMDYFKTCMTGRQLGSVPMFLTQMKQPKAHATEGLFSILLAHDAIPTWGAWARDVRFIHRVWRTLEAFGIGEDDVVFRPYWHTATGAAVTAFEPEGGGPIRPVQIDTYEPEPRQELLAEEAYGAGIYHRPGKRSLVVVFNYTQDDADATLQLDAAALGLDPNRIRATDAFARFDWVRGDRPLTLHVRTRNFRLVWVEEVETVPVDVFPGETPEVRVAGDRPDRPEQSCDGQQIIGDLWENPWQARVPEDTYGTEVAQDFTLDQPASVHRVEVYLRYAGVRGPDVREAVQMRLVRADDRGMPTGEVIVPESGFVPMWVDTSWSYKSYELLRSCKLEPGRYAFVMSKPPEDPLEHYHALAPAFSSENADDGSVATRLLPTGTWQRQNRTLAFGVSGFQR